MSPTSLLHLSADDLRAHAAEDWHLHTAARSAERKWAGVAFVVIAALALVGMLATSIA